MCYTTAMPKNTKQKLARSGDAYDAEILAHTLDDLGNEVASLISRITLVGHREVEEDDNYLYNTLKAASGSIKGALALVQEAELYHLTGGDTINDVIKKAR